MASLLTVAALREHFETDLLDGVVQALIDDAEAEIDAAIGELGSHEDTFRGEILANVLFLTRRASVITSVVETVGDTETELDPDDYRLRHEGRQIERRSDGTNPRSTWGEILVVTYTPADDAPRRKRAAIDLVKLAAQFNAMGSERVGDYQGQAVDYEEQRSQILARLGSRSLGFA